MSNEPKYPWMKLHSKKYVLKVIDAAIDFVNSIPSAASSKSPEEEPLPSSQELRVHHLLDGRPLSSQDAQLAAVEETLDPSQEQKPTRK